MARHIEIKRRALLQKSSALLAGLASHTVLWSPASSRANPPTSSKTQLPAGHDAYFSQLNALLRRDGPGRPVMLLDLKRINHNIDQLKASVGDKKQYRVVVKSLPSVPLLKHVMQRANTRALMVFHQPFLNEVASTFTDADVLLGKPMPLMAARTFYSLHKPNDFNPSRQIQWLIDSHARLLQYQALARELGVQIGVNFEIDVGLHRGGYSDPRALARSLKVVVEDKAHLKLRGLMGYEPQLTGMQADLKHPAVAEVLRIYREFVTVIKAQGFDPTKLTLNGAGSHTLRIYEDDDTMNDLSAGSGVVMPTDFDTHHLRDHHPALFIATPILKRYDENPVMDDPPEDLQRIYYIYGGYWKAQMTSPAKIGGPIYESTNQSPIATSAAVDLQVDDYMFLRPTQSEFVMLQFGDLLVVDEGAIKGSWPVFQQTG